MLRLLLSLTFLIMARPGMAAQIFGIGANFNQTEFPETTKSGYGLSLEYNFLANIADAVYIGPGLRYSGDLYEHSTGNLTSHKGYVLFKVAVPIVRVLVPFIDVSFVPGFASYVSQEEKDSTNEPVKGTDEGYDVKTGFLIRLSNIWALNLNATVASDHKVIFEEGTDKESDIDYSYKSFTTFSIGIGTFADNLRFARVENNEFSERPKRRKSRRAH